MYIYIYIYRDRYIRTYICISISLYIYIYIHIYTHTLIGWASDSLKTRNNDARCGHHQQVVHRKQISLSLSIYIYILYDNIYIYIYIYICVYIYIYISPCVECVRGNGQSTLTHKDAHVPNPHEVELDTGIRHWEVLIVRD